MKRPIEKEKVLERKLTRLIKEAGGLTFKLEARYNAGAPDRLCILPSNRLFFAEIKTTGKKLSPLQEHYYKAITGLGYDMYVIDSTESMLKTLEHYNEKPKRPVRIPK